LSAAWVGFVIPFPFGSAMPYGALLYDFPVSLNCPFDCLTMYAATGESAIPTCWRPLWIARLAAFWSGYTWTPTPGFPAFLHLPFWAVASDACVVPRSTPTEWPQRSASDLIVGPPDVT